MNKIYTLSCLILLIIAGCSKDFLRDYEDRIIGSWRITDIDTRGLGRSHNLPFTDGNFSFEANGRFVWTVSGRTYQGSWDIRRVRNGDKSTRTLQLTAVDFAGQDIRTEYFNEIFFTNTNRFRAFIYDGSRTYVYRFLRQ